MKIIIHAKHPSPITLEQFADEHNLTMEVHERQGHSDSMRWYARFQHSETKHESFLCSTFANGSTPEEAIKNYAKEIAGQTLVVNAYTFSRREIVCPTEFMP